MKYLGQLIFAFVTLMSVFFVWQSLVFGGAAGFGVAWLYILVPALLLATIAIPALSRVPIPVYVLAWIAIYMLAEQISGQWFAPSASGLGYVTGVQIGVMGMAALLIYKLGRALDDFNESVERVTLAEKGAQIPHPRNARAQVETEIDRSRRYEHDFSAIVLEWKPSADALPIRTMVEDIQRAMSERFLSARLGGMISHHTRRTDIVVQEPETNRLIIFCPATDAMTGARLAERIQKLVSKELHADVQYGIGSLEKGEGTLDQVVLQANASLTATIPIPPGTELKQVTSSRLRGLDD
jgi:hypothetical protein